MWYTFTYTQGSFFQAFFIYSIHGDFSMTGYAAGSMLLAGHSEENHACLSDKIYQYPEIIEPVYQSSRQDYYRKDWY